MNNEINHLLNEEIFKYTKKNKNFFVYEPREDSEFILKNAIFVIEIIQQKLNQKYTEKTNKLKILELGIGSGFIAFNILNKFKNIEYTAIDINPDSVNFTSHFYKKYNKLFLKNNFFDVITSDLFSDLNKNQYKQYFDIILFNLPYLPNEKSESNKKIDSALSGGVIGSELTIKFLKELKEYIHKDSIVLFIASSVNNCSNIISKSLDQELYNYEIVDKVNFSFETIFLFKAKLNDLFFKFNGLTFFCEGKHSYTYLYESKKKVNRNKKYIFKIYKTNYIPKEKNILLKVNQFGIGPKLCFKIDDKDIPENILAYEFVNGIYMDEFFEHREDYNVGQIKFVNSMLFPQVIRLDSLGIKKEEFTRITTNAIITNIDDFKLVDVVLIDFERSHYSLKPSNFNQYLEFIKRLFNYGGIKFKLLQKYEVMIKKYKNLKLDYNLLFETACKIMNELFLYANVLSYVLFHQNENRLLTYGEIAKEFNINPRQVGQILKSNLLPDVVHCYKVIKSDGKIGGYYGKTKIDEKVKKLKNDSLIK